ncbi:3-oxoacyl-[acyl-carrier-protein] synthase III C-terminal domain-containing protein [Kitasatospora sp. NPDC097605]|uniref:3-oxoacyl-[acyl-carrier-protein] synthase III C-terminal domain-containing protein n=1 Tax=Kitasatospora sp. NPDC097605 TaxID=3157226 RepID=UPI00332AB315
MTADIAVRHADHPRIGAILRILAKSPATRRFSRPLDVVLADRTFAERNAAAVEDVLRMSAAASHRALADAGLDPRDVDGIVTTSSTTDWVPGLDIALQRKLGLAADISRTALTQSGCGGGVHALTKAVDHVRARSGARVLVAGGEVLSAIHHHDDQDVAHFIFKLLWGDSAVAAVVSGVPLGPGLAVDDTWEYVLPGSARRYRKRVDAAGMHFDSDKDSTQSVVDMAPALRKWLDGWPLDFVVTHTGGLAILADLQRELGLAEEQLVHAYRSLDEDGNLGGPAVLRVLERTYETPPAAGQQGLLLGFGPGFTVGAAKVTWQDGSEA